MKTNLCRPLLAIFTLWLLPIEVQALPDWVPGKKIS